MISLLLETATDRCSVAVAGGDEVLAWKDVAEPHLHASHLTLLIKEVTKEAGLEVSAIDRIVLSDGPGSYTSLRVGAATAKGLCLALEGTELWVVSTLRALAAVAETEGEVAILTTINSRRGEVFGQLFRAADLEELTAPLNVRLTETDWEETLTAGLTTGNILVCGPGKKRLFAEGNPSPKLIPGGPDRGSSRFLLVPASSPKRVDVASYEPFYLNPPFVTKSRKKPLL